MAIFRAKEPFAYTDVNGVPRQVRAGDLLDGADPCVMQRPHLFELVEVAAARRTETASAAPDEVRESKRPARPRTGE